MVNRNQLSSLRSLSVLPRYGVALLSVALALGLALLLSRFELRESFFLIAITITVWFGGIGPGLLAIVLSDLSLDYFFIPPIHTIEVDISRLPYFIVFTSFALLVGWFSKSRRHAEQWLRQARDQLERNVAEQTTELRDQAKILDLTHDSIVVRNMDNVIKYWNRGAEELYGWKTEEAIGKVTHELLKTVFPAPLPQIEAQLLRMDRWEGELVHTKKDGSQVELASRWALQRDQQNRPVAILETNNDITDRKQGEEALRQAQFDLAHMSRVTTMGELTAALAHEVNQPIAAAMTDGNTCLRWLTREPPDLDEARQAALRVVKDAGRAGEIINRIRLAFRKGTPQRALIDVNEVLRELIVLLGTEATRYSVCVRAELQELPLVMADRVQMQQVLMNLMTNGMDAMQDVDGMRELIICSQQSDDGQLMISVSDTGVGLPRQADQIFNAFFTTKPQGTGMGLRISRSIVESHGGRLWAADNTPRGASFHLTLPTNVEAHE